MIKRAREKRDRPVGIKPDIKLTRMENRLYGMTDAILTKLELESQEMREKSERLRKLRLEKGSS